MDRGQLVLEGNPQDVFSQRQVLEDLELGVPMVFELLAKVCEVMHEQRLSSVNSTLTQMENLQQQILQSFRLSALP